MIVLRLLGQGVTLAVRAVAWVFGVGQGSARKTMLDRWDDRSAGPGPGMRL